MTDCIENKHGLSVLIFFQGLLPPLSFCSLYLPLCCPFSHCKSWPQLSFVHFFCTQTVISVPDNWCASPLSTQAKETRKNIAGYKIKTDYHPGHAYLAFIDWFRDDGLKKRLLWKQKQKHLFCLNFLKYASVNFGGRDEVRTLSPYFFFHHLFWLLWSNAIMPERVVFFSYGYNYNLLFSDLIIRFDAEAFTVQQGLLLYN